MALMENLDALRELPDACVDLCYIDPPFNTGKVQALDLALAKCTAMARRSPSVRFRPEP